MSDNTLFGYTGPIMGRRYRFQVSPVVGAYDWVQYLADYRRYDPILFNYLTVATRLYADVSIGPDERAFPKYIARPDYVRGYDRNSAFYLSCPVIGANPTNCSAVQLLGSRVAVANVELRFPARPARRARISPHRAAAAGRPLLLRRRPRLVSRAEGVRAAAGRLRHLVGALSAAGATGSVSDSTCSTTRSCGGTSRSRWTRAGHRGVWTWSLWPSF